MKQSLRALHHLAIVLIGYGYGFAYRQVFHRNYIIGKLRNLVRVAQQHDYGGAVGYYIAQQRVEKQATIGIEADVRIVDNENIGSRSEDVDEQELAQFAAREIVDAFVQNVGNVEPLGHFLPHIGCDFFGYQLLHGRDIVVHHRLGTLLVVSTAKSRESVNVGELHPLDSK